MKYFAVTKRNIALILVAAIALFVFIVIQINGARFADPAAVVNVGKVAFPANTIQGLLQNVVLLLAIVCACLDPYVGYLVGSLMAIGSMLATAMTAILGRNPFVIPGFAMALLTLIVINVIGYLLRRAQKNSVTDLMTGLMNQRGFLYKLEPLVKRKKGSVVYYLLNNYRAINDEYGHEIGDKILKEIGKKMQNTLGKDGDVFRIGGAVFAFIIKDGIDPVKKTAEVIDNLRNKTEVKIEGQLIEYYAESNAGVLPLNSSIKSKDQAVKYADIALINACSLGMNKYAEYDESMSQEAIEEKKTEQMIINALDKGLFYLMYQPQYFVDGKKIRGFEALIRLKDEEGKVVSPGVFIPVAEKSNLIFDIDEYVLNYVSKEFAEVVKEHEDIRVSVNISANGFCRDNFVDKVKRILDENNFPYKNLEIEITEYSMSKSVETTRRNIDALHELGIYIALDDFGTGYTTLAKLLELKANVLKIDKSIVDTIENTDVNRKFVNTIGDMGHLLNCEVLLEGVETDSQLEYIKGMACDCVQGFVWGRPISFEEAVAKLH